MNDNFHVHDGGCIQLHEHNVYALSSRVRARFSSFRVHYDNSRFQTDEVGNDDDNHVRSLWGALAGPSTRITAYDADNYSLIRRVDELSNGGALKSQPPAVYAIWVTKQAGPSVPNSTFEMNLKYLFFLSPRALHKLR